jgi:hypothetical protein
MDLAERVRRSLENSARRILRETWSLEGTVREFRVGRGRRLVWNEDGMTIEISDDERRPLARYRISVRITLFKVDTPAVSAIPVDAPLDAHLAGRSPAPAVRTGEREA